MHALAQVLQQAAATVAACEQLPIEQAKRSFAEAFQQVVQVRNGVIVQRRAQDAAGATDRQLKELNALISLMASIEFPLGGFHGDRFASTVRLLHKASNDFDAPDHRDPAA